MERATDTGVWVMGSLALVVVVAVAYPVTFALTMLVAHAIDTAGRFITVPWRCGAALLIALAEWLEARSARPAVWVCFGGMTLYAFFFGANVFGRMAAPAAFDAFACIGFLVLALRAAREDDRARRSGVSDPGAVSPT